MEIVLALAVGVAAFVLVAVVGTVARSHVSAALLGVLLLLTVLAVARFAGILYSLPVGVVTLLAFDWYFLPPLRSLDAAAMLVLGLVLVMTVTVGAFATHAGRRATGSEEARGVLADEQAALRRVATLVARQASPEQVFAAVTEEAGKLLHLDSAHLVAYERDEAATVVGAWNRQGPPTHVGRRTPLDGDNVVVRVFRTQRAARIDQYTEAAGLAAGTVRGMGVHAVVGTPILVEGRVWGVMAVGSSRPGPLPVGTESRIGAFTELVAVAISNAEAREELERLAQEQAALSRVATLVAEALPPGDVFTAVAAEIAGVFDVPLVGLFRYETDLTATVIAAAGKMSPHLARRWSFPPDDPSLLASLLRTGQPVRFDDAQVRGVGMDLPRELGISSAAGVPVTVSSRIWGAVTVASGSDRPPLPARTLDRLAAFTELVATAIANSDARTEIERLAQGQAALRRVATLVAQGAATGEVFAAVAHEISEVMHLPIAAVERYAAEDGGTITMVAAWSDRPHPFQPGTRWPIDRSGIAARVRQTGRAARSEDYSHRQGAFAAKVREAGIQSIVGAPIIVDGEFWGMVAVASTDGSVPDHAEDRLTEFTELLGTAIANTQSRAELSASRARVVAAADETRRRLERDLHDGIQQRLVSLGLKARIIETMTPRPADVIQNELSLLADGLGTSLEELREISRGIHPAVLSEAGLGPALKGLARRSAVPVELDLNLGLRLGERLEVAAYYVASEALTNAAKHAHASVIVMRVDCRDGALTLSIRDDGVGGADSSRGSGIIGLKDRVEALGGSISVLSPPRDGTTLYVRLPADPSAAPTAPRDAP